MIAVTVLLYFSQRGKDAHSHIGIVVGLIFAGLTAALMIALGITLLDGAGQKSVIGASTIAMIIDRYRLAWIIAVPAMMIVTTFMKPKEKGH
jgi:energy-converting hydrogenase Eha subunit B